MSQRSVYLHSLKGFGALLFLGLIGHGAHIVQPVGDLDENDTDVLGHGKEHLAHILHLLVFLAGVLHPGQLGDALHQIGHHGAELLFYVIIGHGGVLYNVVQQGGHNGILVQPHVHGDVRRRHAVGDIGGAVPPELAFMSGVSHLIGSTNPLHVHFRA